MSPDPFTKYMYATKEWSLDRKKSKARRMYELTCFRCGNKFMYDNRRFGLRLGAKFCNECRKRK